MIDFTRAMGSAWERMAIILFRPFDPMKWALIGFNAFLALLEGGMSFNNNLPFGSHQNREYTYQTLPAGLHAFKQFTGWLGSLPSSPLLAVFLGLGVVYVLAWLALVWVGCRGQFILIDNIVRNRASLVWPWRQYAHQGNVWFLFNLALVAFVFLFYAAAAAVFLVMNWSWINAERDPNSGELVMVGASAFFAFSLGLIGSIVVFLIRSLAQPLYFMQTMGLGQALTEVLGLIFKRPGSILAYLLISFLIAIVGGIVSVAIFCAACCAIFWISCVPFAGTLLLTLVISQLILPVIIFTRCFQLDCLAQFGPQYDVWNVAPTPVPTGPAAPL